MIPGPSEVALDNINHLLEPLVAEFLVFWDGIFFTSTPRHPEGRVVRAALWPLIADLPAIRKVARFAGHSAAHFCAHCNLLKRESANIDIMSWPPRLDHRHHAEEWRDAISLKEQEEVFKEHGVRYSVLLKLPYWQPINFLTVDIMHCVLLGMLEDHSTSCLKISGIGKALEAAQKNQAKKGVYRPCYVSLPNQLTSLKTLLMPEPIGSR